MPFLRGLYGGRGQAGLNFAFGNGGANGRSGGFGGLTFFPFLAQFPRPASQIRRNFAIPNLRHKVDDLLSALERKAVPAGSGFFGCLHAKALDGFGQQAHRLLRTCLGACQSSFERGKDRLQIVAVFHGDYAPTQVLHRVKRRLHAKGVLRDSAGQLGVVVGDYHKKGIDPSLGRQARNGGKGFLGLAFHGRAIGHGQKGRSFAAGRSISDGQSLRLRHGRAERPVAQKNAFGVQVRFPVPRQLAGNGPKSAQVFQSHAVKAEIRPQGVNAVFRMAGVVHKVVGLVPRAILSAKEDAVNRRHNLRKGRRPAPMTGGASVHGVNVHQGDQSASGPRIAEDDVAAVQTFHRNGILGNARRIPRQARRKRKGG